MTLRDWSERWGKPVQKGLKGGTYVLSQSGEGGHSTLWNLTDFAVSSVSGPVVWMVPRSCPCTVCGADMGWDRPSGVCGEACLRKGQGG